MTTRTAVLFAAVLSALFSGLSYSGEVKITSPSNGDEVGAKVIVEGTSKYTGEGHIWVLAHLKLLQDQWWPQPKPVVDANGDWQALVYIGQSQDIGYEFEIAVAYFGEEAESEILKYHEIGKKTGQWLPISFPKTTSEIEMVTVKKTSH